ncbi:MAG TPA: AI-2E family transporter, partial [Candidatus Paceibacterota bacterium]|nr:AI-2E family transporter [Candidatus Paceibacterota bacterium]
MDKNVSITITTGTVIRILLILVIAYAVWTLRDLVLLVLTAIIIASAIEPGVDFFIRHRVPRVVAVTFMYIAVFGSLFGVVYAFFPPILEDTQNFLSSAPQYLNTLNIPEPLTSLALSPAGGENQAQSILDTLLTFRSAFSDASGGAVRVVSTFFGGIFALVLVIVLSFYFAIQKTGVDDFVRLITPAKHEEYVIDLWLRA